MQHLTDIALRMMVPALALTVATCAINTPPPRDADVIVIGGGIAGLAAALEAEAQGARVLVLEASSVGGGHAVKAGGFALVGTPLQESKGYKDSPDIAYQDLMTWGGDANPEWVRRYVEASRPEVHDWLTALGVKFVFILNTPEHSVPRFHFTGGSAVNAIVPMLREALHRDRIAFRWNTEVTALLKDGSAVVGARTRDTRTGQEGVVRAPSVIIATGGSQGSLERVREAWRSDIPPPERLYSGAGQFAMGAGLRLAKEAGGALTRLDHQVTFSTGLPNPRDKTGTRGLLTQNPAAIWVNGQGKRFVSELAPTKVADGAVLRMRPATHWLVFDSEGLKELRVRDAIWLNKGTLEREVLNNPALVKHADSIGALAAAAGLPAANLEATVARYNAAVDKGTDEDFQRFTAGHPDQFAHRITQPPFYAVQLFPLARKNMGGIAIDRDARALQPDGQPVPGLFAAGEVTGVAGVNGSYGGEGTFLGPSVFIGRLSGRSAALLATRGAGVSEVSFAAPRTSSPAGAPPSTPRTKIGASDAPAGVIEPAQLAQLTALLSVTRPGYWHFESVHNLVREHGTDCATCHQGVWPPGPAVSREQRLVQTESCTRCH